MPAAELFGGGLCLFVAITFVKYGIPLFLAAYLFLVWLSPRISAKGEIYPFFSWRLFASTPGWELTEIGLIVHTIDGAPVVGARYYVVPGGSIRDHKAPGSTIRACRTRPPACDAEVEQRLYAIVNRRTGGEDVEFSIVSMRIDLRTVHGDLTGEAIVGANIPRSASGDARRSDFSSWVFHWCSCLPGLPGCMRGWGCRAAVS